MTERRAPGRAPASSRLRGSLSVIAAAAASFLVILALLTARVVRGTDPALRASASSAVVVSGRGHTVLRTTASGRVLAAATQAPSAGAGRLQPATLVTRASGLLAGEGGRDE